METISEKQSDTATRGSKSSASSKKASSEKVTQCINLLNYSKALLKSVDNQISKQGKDLDTSKVFSKYFLYHEMVYILCPDLYSHLKTVKFSFPKDENDETDQKKLELLKTLYITYLSGNTCFNDPEFCLSILSKFIYIWEIFVYESLNYLEN